MSDSGEATAVAPRDARAFAFAPPWPSPARRATTLALELARESAVTVGVYDGAGRLVAVPIAGERLPAGRTVREWRPGTLPSGRYHLRARVGGAARTRSLVWLGGR